MVSFSRIHFYHGKVVMKWDEFKRNSTYVKIARVSASLLIILCMLSVVFLFPKWNYIEDYSIKSDTSKHWSLYSLFYEDESRSEIINDPLHHHLISALENNPCVSHLEPFIIVVRMSGSDKEAEKIHFMKDLAAQMKKGYSDIGCVRAFVFATDSSKQAREIFNHTMENNDMKTIEFIADRQGRYDVSELDNDVRHETPEKKRERKQSRDMIYIFKRMAMATETKRVLYLENNGHNGLCHDALKRSYETVKHIEDDQRMGWDSVLLHSYANALLFHTNSMKKFYQYANSHIRSGQIHDLLAQWRDDNGRNSFVIDKSILYTHNEECGKYMRNRPGLRKTDWFDNNLCEDKPVFPCARGQRMWGWFNQMSNWVSEISIPEKEIYN